MPIETGMYFTANNKKRLSFQEKFQQALDENVLTRCFYYVFFFLVFGTN
jgi:hypothetical protein